MGCFNVNLYCIQPETQILKFGHECLDLSSDKRYRVLSHRSSSSIQLKGGGEIENAASTCRLSYSKKFFAKAGVYGELVEGVNILTSNSYNFNSSDFIAPNDGCRGEGGIYETIIQKAPTGERCISKATSKIGTPAGCDGILEEIIDVNCTTDGFCFPPFNYDIDTIDCTTSNQIFTQIENNTNLLPGVLIVSAKAEATLNLSSEINLNEFKSVAEDRNRILTNIYKNNLPQNPSGDKCLGGNKDDCWEQVGGLTLKDKDSAIQKWIFKPTISKETLDKQIKTNTKIEGKMFLYTLTGQYPYPSPCGCASNFNGEILLESSFTINQSSDIFKDNLYSAKEISYTNNEYSGPNKSFTGCIKLND